MLPDFFIDGNKELKMIILPSPFLILLAIVSEPLKSTIKLEIADGSTFLMSVVTDEYIFCIQIGDGDCVAFAKDGKAVAYFGGFQMHRKYDHIPM